MLFDAFCGTGSVSDYLKDSINLIVNDMIKWSVIYTQGRIAYYDCNFNKLCFDPFESFNSSKKIKKRFFYQNYSPSGSEVKYFTKENAGRIDYFI